MEENIASFAKERCSNFTAAVKDGDFASQLSDNFLSTLKTEGAGMREKVEHNFSDKVITLR